ncbi:hypothetical protein AB0C61_11720 [Streptomyces sp. NPDC048680]|uniref:hypothetical protein n=1 Tax=Streptomyces sp. NPDC048680 TaxID=3155492 RepID=UPI003420A92D
MGGVAADDLVAAFIQYGDGGEPAGVFSSGWMMTKVLSLSFRSLARRLAGGSQPLADRGDLDRGLGADRELVVSGSDSPVLLEAADAAFHAWRAL